MKHLTWEEIKDELLACQQDCYEVNGMNTCKNCGTDFIELIKDVEWLLDQPKRDADDLISKIGGRTLQ